MNEPDLTGRHVLLVEDEHMVARSLARLLDIWNARIVGPAASFDAALDLVRTAERIDFALLDINLRGALVYPVADALTGRGVPFALTTGYDKVSVPAPYCHAAILRKPYDPAEIAQVLLPLIGKAAIIR